MAMYSAQLLSDIEDALGAAEAESTTLRLRVVKYHFHHPLAREHAYNGFLRRLRLLKLTLENVFALFPPTQDKPLSSTNLENAEINLQSFIFNTAGSLDNLAWIWVHENGLLTSKGKPFANSRIGLGPGYSEFRESLPTELLGHLRSIDDWFRQQEDYRHSLAHRIPPYLPPYFVQHADVERHNALQLAADAAVLNGDDLAFDQLSEEQRALGIISPLMLHDSRSRPVIVHAMIIANYRTVIDLGMRIIEELDVFSGTNRRARQGTP